MATNESLAITDPERAAQDPDPEVRKKARRRRYSAAYKQRILEEADRRSAPAEIDVLPRGEGLYSSILSRRSKEMPGTGFGPA